MNSIHYPYLVEHNKYQELLCTSLERKGFKVVKVEKSIFKLLEYCIFSKIEILHFHWLHGITNSQGKVKTFFRIFLFIFCIIIWKIKSKKIINKYITMRNNTFSYLIQNEKEITLKLSR